MMVEDFLAPIKADGWIREFRVVCDSTNNTDTVLNARKFKLGIFIKVTVNSQETELVLTRLPQGAVIADFI